MARLRTFVDDGSVDDVLGALGKAQGAQRFAVGTGGRRHSRHDKRPGISAERVFEEPRQYRVAVRDEGRGAPAARRTDRRILRRSAVVGADCDERQAARRRAGSQAHHGRRVRQRTLRVIKPCSSHRIAAGK